jgi:hypothetical protein
MNLGLCAMLYLLFKPYATGARLDEPDNKSSKIR